MDINTISDFRQAIRNGPYAWPGGYPLYFIMADGEAISFKAASDNRRFILASLRDKGRYRYDGWLPAAFVINWEDGDLYCAETNERIESAYAEPEEKENADLQS